MRGSDVRFLPLADGPVARDMSAFRGKADIKNSGPGNDTNQSSSGYLVGSLELMSQTGGLSRPSVQGEWTAVLLPLASPEDSLADWPWGRRWRRALIPCIAIGHMAVLTGTLGEAFG